MGNVTRRPVPDQSCRDEMEDRAERVLHKVRGALRDQHELPVLGVKVAGWWLVVPLAGYLVGSAAGKLISVGFRFWIRTITGSPQDLSALGGIIGVIVALMVWVGAPRKQLGLVRLLAVGLGLLSAANAVSAALETGGGEFLKFLIGAGIGFLLYWNFKELRDWLTPRMESAETANVTLALVMIGGAIILTVSPIIQWFGLDFWGWTVGRLGPAGGGMVVASLWFTGLWHFAGGD